jgi:5'-3' exonuclease
LDEEGERVHLEFTQREDRKYMEDSWEKFQKDLSELLEMFYTEDYIMAVKGDDNFRDILYPEYKANRRRQAEKRPDNRRKFVNAVTELAIMEDIAIPAHGREADDLVRIWAEESIAEGEDFVVVTIDKDLKCIPGKFYDPSKKISFTITPEEAMRHYYEQLIQGDPTDNIPGVPGVGPVGAEEAVRYCFTDEAYQDVVVGHYIAAYEDEWFEMLELNGKLIHIQKTMDDIFNLAEWPIAQELR